MKKLRRILYLGSLLCVAGAANLASPPAFAASVNLSCPSEYTDTNATVSCTLSASGFTIYGLSATIYTSIGEISLSVPGGVNNYNTATAPQLVAVSGKASGSTLATINVSKLSNGGFTLIISNVELSDGENTHYAANVSRSVPYRAPAPAAPTTPATPAPSTPSTPSTPTPTTPSKPSTSTPSEPTPSAPPEEPAENVDASEPVAEEDTAVAEEPVLEPEITVDKTEEKTEEKSANNLFLPLLIMSIGLCALVVALVLAYPHLKKKLSHKH
ncbi:MAG: hypothetical protein LBQ02_00485 [Candidatus Nomurabacteria bacterium]|jgi:hypothetical protein|nr:hypothetical protein [Candidatus Nomurabacteria bacterium]